MPGDGGFPYKKDGGLMGAPSPYPGEVSCHDLPPNFLDYSVKKEVKRFAWSIGDELMILSAFILSDSVLASEGARGRQ